MTTTESRAPSEQPAKPLLDSLAVTALVAYFGCVFLLNETTFGIHVGFKLFSIILIATFAACYAIYFLISKRAPSLAGLTPSIPILMSLATLIVFEAVYATILASNAPPAAVPGLGRDRDSHYLNGEYYPRMFFPEASGFRIFKPNMSVTASSFGTLYSTQLLQSPTLVSSTFEPRTVTLTINDLGFRDPGSLRDASVLALGDSFTFGWGVNIERTWLKQLQSLTSIPIYNLGINGASPQEEFELLKYILAQPTRPTRVKHVLWLIYEGNDLEEDANTERPLWGDQKADTYRNTIFQSIMDLPLNIKRQAIITKFRTGQLKSRLESDGIAPSHWVVDGIPTVFPFFSSPQLGNRLFLPTHIERGQQPESYVLNHPNREKIEEAFAGMAKLAKEEGFDVSVILTPTAERLHGRYFTDFPKLSPAPYFLQFISELAGKSGFAVIDLRDAMSAHADKELYYFRDDDHWNERGHALAASILNERLGQRLSEGHAPAGSGR